MNTLNPTSWKAWAKSFPAQADKDVPYKSPFTIVNKGSATQDAEILLYDVIGRDWWSGEGWAANDFAEKLKEIDANAKLVIGINSPGGNVDDGLAIFNMLQRRGNVTTRNDGMAASIASVILQAGDTRQSAESAMVMIHKAWSVFAGNADDSRKFADILDKHDQLIAETYARRSGKPAAGWLDLMASESWFTGNEAKDAGLVDEIYQPAKKNLAAQSSLPSQPMPNGNAQADDSAALISASAVAVADGQLTAAKQTKTKETNSMPETKDTPAVANPPADFTPIINAINALGEKLNTVTAKSLPGAAPLTGTHRVENLGNPLIEKFNAIYDVEEKAKFAKTMNAELRKQLLISKNITDLPANYDRFDFQNPKIVNANTVDSALANTILSGDFVTTMRPYIAPWSAFTRKVEFSPVSKRQTIEVPLYSSAGSKQQNATNYETGDSVLAPIAVVAAEESKSFHVSRPEQNLGLALAGLVPTNARVLAEGIHAKMTALMIAANYGAATTIGAASSFDATDLPAILALGKSYDRCTLLLDGGHLAYLLPGDRTKFAFGEPGAYGFDGGIYKNNLWTGGVANICGFVCGPDALVNGWGMAEGLPSGEAISQSTVDVNGIPFGLSVWFSRATRAVWASFQVMHGCAVGDATQAENLVTS